MARWSVASCAKLNLGLKVLGRRPDGFHDLVSLFLEVDLQDRVLLEDRNDRRIRVRCEAPGIPCDERNLAWQAAQALCREAGVRRGVAIELRKAIPPGGGLGGGSSNAAAVLRTLNQGWGLGVPPGRLSEIGARVGSDVPFFLHGGAAVVEGRGERVLPVRARGELLFVLVFPGFAVDTGRAFGELRIGLTGQSPYIRFLNSVKESGEVDLAGIAGRIENDFLPAISRAHPIVPRLLGALDWEGAVRSSVSGTGSTLFGCFGDEAGAARAASRLREQGVACTVCRPAGGARGASEPGCRVV